MRRSFLWKVPLAECISNRVPTNKKKGTIHVCIDFIDQIIDECARNEIFSFIDGFSGYNQITINPKDQ